MADTEDLKSSEETRGGSTPSSGTIIEVLNALRHELEVYHISQRDCPRKRGCYCRICGLLHKARGILNE